MRNKIRNIKPFKLGPAQTTEEDHQSTSFKNKINTLTKRPVIEQNKPSNTSIPKDDKPVQQEPFYINQARIDKARGLKYYDAQFAKNLGDTDAGRWVRGYNKVKEFQSKLPWLPRTLSEIVTSPADMGYTLGKMQDKRRNALMTDKQKSQQKYDLAGSGLDLAGLVTLGRGAIATIPLKTAIKKVSKVGFGAMLPAFLARDISQQVVEDEFGYASGLKEKK